MPDNIKKVLFIDRDGTLITEPEDEQIDSFSKLTFYPGALQYLPRIARELDFELVLVTNQDGLGTDSHPEANFWPVHRLVMDTFAGEGAVFAAEHIDRTFPAEQAPTRKPATGLLQQYFDKEKYDLANSFVIGDRINDAKLAQNLGAKAIWLRNNDSLGAAEAHVLGDGVVALETGDWKRIYEFLKLADRTGEHHRKTNETDIAIRVNLDGTGQANIDTGLPFFDHMLDQIARHGSIDLDIKVKGDLHIDEHHTIEDTGLALGQALREALGDKRGIGRYGFTLPMDETLASAALDFSGRPYFVFEGDFKREKVGDMPTELVPHFFRSLSDAAGLNLHLSVRGDNDHHKVEAAFKALARALRQAIRREGKELPSTKGAL